jgi:hypothetical protein
MFEKCLSQFPSHIAVETDRDRLTLSARGEDSWQAPFAAGQA